MRRQNKSLLIGFMLAVASASAHGAGAGEGKMSWKNDERKGLFRCQIPQDWSFREGALLSRGTLYSGPGGTVSIEVVRLGPKAQFRAPKDYLAAERASDWKRSKTTVEGRSVQRYSRRYSLTSGGDDIASRVEWVSEEIVFLPQSAGASWALRFRSASLAPQSEPQGLDAWRHFLKTFRPD